LHRYYASDESCNIDKFLARKIGLLKIKIKIKGGHLWSVIIFGSVILVKVLLSGTSSFYTRWPLDGFHNFEGALVAFLSPKTDLIEELCITIILVPALLVSSEIFTHFANLVVVPFANTPFS